MLHIFPIFANFMTREKKKKNIGHCYAKLEFMGFRNGNIVQLKKYEHSACPPISIDGKCHPCFWGK